MKEIIIDNTLEMYKKNLKHMAEIDSSNFISCTSIKHFLCLIAIFFEDCENEARLFCNINLFKLMMENHKELLTKFLNEKKNSLKVLVEVNDELGKELIYLLKEINFDWKNGIFRIKTEKKIIDILGYSYNYFAVFDNKKYYVLYDKKIAGIASFNDMRTASFLLSIFDNVYDISKDLEG